MKKLLLIPLLVVSTFAFDFSIPVGGGNSADIKLDIGECLGDIAIPDAADVCQAIDSFNTAYSKDFSIGGCTIGVKSDLSCLTSSLATSCKKIIGKKVLDPLSSALVDSDSFNFLKGEAFKKKKCAERNEVKDVSFPSKETQSSIVKATPWSIMGPKHGPFSSSIDDLRDCMKISGKKCLDDGFIKLPKDALAAEKSINDAATQISSADSTVTKNISVIQVELSKKVKACKGVQTCINAVMSSKASPDALIKKELGRIEMASSLELSVMKKATRGDTYFIYKDKKSITDSLPLTSIIPYSSGVTRQNAADALILGLYKEIIEIKKESIYASYGGIGLVSSTYEPSQSIDGLKKSLSTMEEESKKSGTQGGTPQ